MKNHNIFAGICLLVVFLLLGKLSHSNLEVADFMEGPAKNYLSLNEIITHIDGKPVYKIDEFRAAFKNKLPGQQMLITTNKDIYLITLAEDNNKPRLGVYVKELRKNDFIMNLLFWAGILLVSSSLVFSSIILLNFLNLADIIITQIGLSAGAYEANPLSRFLFESLGFWQTALIKIVAVVLFSLVLKKAGSKFVYFACLLYFTVVLSNLFSFL